MFPHAVQFVLSLSIRIEKLSSSFFFFFDLGFEFFYDSLTGGFWRVNTDHNKVVILKLFDPAPVPGVIVQAVNSAVGHEM